MGKAVSIQRLQKLLALTASDNEGEATNAAVMLARGLREAGIDLSVALQPGGMMPQPHPNHWKEKPRREYEEMKRRQEQQKEELKRWAEEKLRNERARAAAANTRQASAEERAASKAQAAEYRAARQRRAREKMNAAWSDVFS